MANVILWEDAGFGGDKLELDGDVLILGDYIHFDGLTPDTWNDEASSIEVSGGTVRFWTDWLHEGDFVDLGPGKHDMNEIGLPNDSISSVDFAPFA